MNITGLTMPVHDPPVAWRAGTRFGFPAIAYPAMPEHQVAALTDSPRYMDPEPIVLDGEPGRRQ